MRIPNRAIPVARSAPAAVHRSDHWDPYPSDAIGMQDEWLVSRESRVADFGPFRRLIVGRLGRDEIGDVVARPFFVFRVPPDQFLSFAPRLAVRTRRSAVVEDAAVGRPGKSPAVAVEIPATRVRSPDSRSGLGKTPE